MDDVWEDYFFCVDDAEGHRFTAASLDFRKLKPVQVIMIFFVENLIRHDR